MLSGQGDRPVRVDRDFSIDEVPVDRVVRLDESPCTQYTELGSTVDLWDWRAERYDLIYYQDNNADPAIRNIRSPFQSAGANINHLSLHAGSELRDYEPAQGWELLYRHLGTVLDPVQEPSFGLYNRLDGRIRIFFYLEPNDGTTPYNVLINLRQKELDNLTKSTAFFENLNIPANAIRNFDKAIGLSGVVQLNKGIAGSQWYILETVASYDPCVCQHESSLTIEPILTYKTSVNFTMDGTGTSTATYDAGNPLSALGYFNGLAGKIYSGYKKYDSFTDYKEESDATKSQTVKVWSGLLSGFANGLNPVSGVTELLGFVLGKKSVAEKPKLTGFNHNFNFTANGAERDTSVYEPYDLYTPGSFYHDGMLQANRSIYDNALGVFAVLEAPVVQREVLSTYHEGDFGDLEYADVTPIRWRFAGGLQYHINTIAGISSQPVQLLASLVWTDCENGSNFYATPAINITCLQDFVVEFENVVERTTDPRTGELFYDRYFNGCNSDPQLQIVAVLTSTAPTPGQEILYSARYRTRTVRVPNGTLGQNPFEDMSSEEISRNCVGAIPRQLEGLGRFCDQRYNPDFGKSGQGEAVLVEETLSRKEQELSQLAAFPNPFVDQLSIELTEDWTNSPLQFKLHDVLGRLMWEKKSTIVRAGKYVLADNLGHLTPGTYLMTISGKDFVETLTLQKK